jgi:hypothetical protein
MSYEGYEIYLCQNGHKEERDCYDDLGPEQKCSCGAFFCWHYAVDQTNDNGVAPVLVINTLAEYDECPTCEHKERKKVETFCIPSNAGCHNRKYKINVPTSTIKFSASYYVGEYKFETKEFDSEEEAHRYISKY